MATFFFAAGGTGGHVIPAIPVAQDLAARGHRCIFIGTRKGAEARLVPQAGFDLEFIESAGLQRRSIAQMLGALWKLPTAVLKVRQLIARYRPVALLSLGGYVAGPAVLAAFTKSLPVVAVEPNAVPGLVTRKTAGRIAKACVNFEETLRWFPSGKAVVTGVPVRAEFTKVEARGRDAAPGEITVLITGGSQGSQTLNRAARQSWPLWLRWQSDTGKRVRLVLQCGAAQESDLRQSFAETNLAGNVSAFIADFPGAIAEADLVVARAGASTVAELCVARKPSILVPFPFAADDHQTRNAEAMQRAGASILVADKDWTGTEFVKQITQLLSQPETLVEMAESAGRLARPDAARKTADILLEVAEKD